MTNCMQKEIDWNELDHIENNPGSQKHFDENKEHFSNQCRIVYEALLRGERLSTKRALLLYGIGDLRRRIKDLKDQWKVPVQAVFQDGTRFKEYFL